MNKNKIKQRACDSEHRGWDLSEISMISFCKFPQSVDKKNSNTQDYKFMQNIEVLLKIKTKREIKKYNKQ